MSAVTQRVVMQLSKGQVRKKKKKNVLRLKASEWQNICCFLGFTVYLSA